MSSNVFSLLRKSRVRRITFIFLFFFHLDCRFYPFSGDIIIERWLPYGPPPERRKIVQSAPPPARYSEPSHTIVVYDSVQTHVVRKLERLGVTEENPDAYVARYGSSLLNSASLVQQARDAGVIEDIVNFSGKNVLPLEKTVSILL